MHAHTYKCQTCTKSLSVYSETDTAKEVYYTITRTDFQQVLTYSSLQPSPYEQTAELRDMTFPLQLEDTWTEASFVSF